MSERSSSTWLRKLGLSNLEIQEIFQQNDPTLTSNEIVVGGIYEVADLETMTVRAVAVVAEIHENSESAAICLLHEYEKHLTDSDLLLSPDDTGYHSSLVLNADIVAVAWFAQLGESLGNLDGQIIEAIPRLADYSCPSPLIEKTGPPVRGKNDPMWRFKEEMSDLFNALTSHCRSWRIEGKIFSDSFEDPATREFLSGINLRTAADKPIITMRRNIVENSAVSTYFVPEDSQEKTGVIDPAVFDIKEPMSISEAKEFLNVLSLGERVKMLSEAQLENICRIFPGDRDLLVRAIGNGAGRMTAQKQIKSESSELNAYGRKVIVLEEERFIDA